MDNNNKRKRQPKDLNIEDIEPNTTTIVLECKNIFLGRLCFQSDIINGRVGFEIQTTNKQLRLSCYDGDDDDLKEEFINFSMIKQVNWGTLGNRLGLCFISILLNILSELKHVSVGRNKVIDPDMSDFDNFNNDNPNSSKYVLIILIASDVSRAVEVFRQQHIKLAFVPMYNPEFREKWESNMKAFLKRDAVDRNKVLDKIKSDFDIKERRRSNKDIEVVGDPSDREVILCYPMDKNATDVIQIYKCDMKRFKEPEYFNDNLIDLKIKYMIEEVFDKKKMNKVYAFNSQFYQKLIEKDDAIEQYDLVKKWTKKFNLFEKDYIFIPICLDLHWSLCTICKPLHWIESRFKEASIGQNSNDEACLLHMDSLDMHKTKQIHKTITNYLSNEWKIKNKDDEELWKNEHLNSKINLFAKLPTVKPICSKQINGFDCGVYVIHYVETILNAFPRTSMHYRKSLLAPQFEKFILTQQQITLERRNYKEFLSELSQTWKEMQKNK